MSAGGQHWINDVWYGQRPRLVSVVLLPLSWLFRLVVFIRRRLYAWGQLRSIAVGAPVIVVGNLSVGGTGKTPVTIWLVNALAERGIRAGVVSRGYQGLTGASPLPVLGHSDPNQVGDEPVLIAERCQCPVIVHPDRVAAARLLLEQNVDVVVADDGLQHYALARDVEFAVVDGHRQFGNGRLLPAGPLREPLARLRSVARILVNSPTEHTRLPELAAPVSTFVLKPGDARRLGSDESRPLEAFAGQAVHAVAAIGNPERFFRTLEEFDLRVIPHPRADHAELSSDDFAFTDGLPVFITEKDAVKCRHVEHNDAWYVPVDAEFSDDAWLDEVVELIRDRQPSAGQEILE